MNATDELRALLDERGVEHYDGTETTLWLKDGVGYRASADEGLNGFIQLRLWCITPAQAVEATLGSEDTYTREDMESQFVRGYSLGCLANGEGWNENECMLEEEMAELGWERRRGKCHNTSNVTDKYGQARFVCSACGAWLDSRMLWNPEYPNGESPFVKDCKLNYCPNCGARVVG